MEFVTRATAFFSSDDKRSPLDTDDMNGPGSWEIPRPTGYPAVDFALFKISRYGESESVNDRLLFTKELISTVKELGSKSLEVVPGLLRKLVRIYSG